MASGDDSGRDRASNEPTTGDADGRLPARCSKLRQGNRKKKESGPGRLGGNGRDRMPGLPGLGGLPIDTVNWPKSAIAAPHVSRQRERHGGENRVLQ